LLSSLGRLISFVMVLFSSIEVIIMCLMLILFVMVVVVEWLVVCRLKLNCVCLSRY